MKNLKTISKALVLTALVATQANASNVPNIWSKISAKASQIVDKAAEKSSNIYGAIEEYHWKDKVRVFLKDTTSKALTKAGKIVDKTAEKSSEIYGNLENIHWNDTFRKEEKTVLEERIEKRIEKRTEKITEKAKFIMGDGETSEREIDYFERKVDVEVPVEVDVKEEVPVTKIVEVRVPGVKSKIVSSKFFTKAGQFVDKAAEKSSRWYGKLEDLRLKDKIKAFSKNVASKAFKKAGNAVDKVAEKTSKWYGNWEDSSFREELHKMPKKVASTMVFAVKELGRDLKTAAGKVPEITSNWYGKCENIQWKEKGKNFFSKLKKKLAIKKAAKNNVEQHSQKIVENTTSGISTFHNNLKSAFEHGKNWCAENKVVVGCALAIPAVVGICWYAKSAKNKKKDKQRS